ncbi:MAG: polysaccharide deacetylase family protein [Planctomycetaceae bacterium]
MNSDPPLKIVVFTGQLTYSTRKAIVEIDRIIPGLSWLIVLHAPRKTFGKLLSNQWRNFRRNGLRWIPHTAAELCRRIAARISRKSPDPFPGFEFRYSPIASQSNWRIVTVEDIHSESTLSEVRNHAPDLGLSLAAPILREPLFSIPRLGTINLHKGKVPDYRGMPPAFWELWNDEKSVGCTVHRVDNKLDTGAMIRQTTVDREKFSTVRGLQLQLDEVGVELMCDAVKQILFETPVATPQQPGGKTYRQPTLKQIAMLESSLNRLQPRLTSYPKQALKNVIGYTAFQLWRMGLGKLPAPRVTILLYHHVTDGTRDFVSIGIEQFDRQMSLLREYCQPVSINEVLDFQTVPRSNKPLVAVTFDDGYFDNFLNAAPILKRNAIPAAFFLSTGIVGTAQRFPHDIKRGNPLYPNMNWDQVRTMQDWGFTIGSHTVNHIDCAAVSEEILREELAQSRDDLYRELGLQNPLFAYPYGRRDNMTPRGRELVKEAGYSGCLSAYGGSNISTVDRYNVLRGGIHWEFSDQEFLFACLGLR